MADVIISKRATVADLANGVKCQCGKPCRLVPCNNRWYVVCLKNHYRLATEEEIASVYELYQL